MPLTIEKLQRRQKLIERAAWRRVVPLDGTLYLPSSPSPVSRPSELCDAPWQPLNRSDQWGIPWHTVWLRQPLTVPPDLRDSALWLHLRLREGMTQWSPDLVESQIFIDDAPFAGLDGEHRLALLPPLNDSSEIFLQVHAAQPQPFGGLELVVIDEPTWRLAHTLRVGIETVEELDPNGLERSALLQRLNEAINLLDLREGPSDYAGAAQHGRIADDSPPPESFYASVRVANDYVESHWPGDFNTGKRPRIVATGHAHIDVAWLWPLWRTRQKTAHTFSTVLRLMEQYPEFTFTASTPQLYAWLKQDYPDLYAQVKQRVREGRWEPIGAMWLEADCNLPSGESLVRQFLFGMRFFKEEFGIRDRVLWMPDVFGYSGALPQIMRGCGIDTFMTTKISWNQFNRMPYDTFRWRGIDGSEVLAHFVTTPDPSTRYYTYNGFMTPKEVAASWREYRQKAINDELLHLTGYGDGGGGPTHEQIETAQRLRDMPGMPQVRWGTANEFFARLHERVDSDPRLPVWSGELYLEYHRGTFTSQAWIKQANRRAEQLYHDAEFLDAWATTHGGYESQRERLNQGWQLILLNQFHDILPGSSIAEVYREAREQYAAIERIGREVCETALRSLLADRDGPMAINTLGWERHDPIFVPESLAGGLESAPAVTQAVERLDGARGLLINGVRVPAYGAAPLTHASGAAADRDEAVTHGTTARDATLIITPESLENRFFRIALDEHGEIASLWDKRHEREVIAAGGRANALVAFEDRPLRYDAWDIDIYFEEKAYPIQAVERIEVVESGPVRGGVEIRRRFLNSTIRQRLLLYRDLPRIDFETEIDWHEHQILLKAAFPLNVNTTRATHEIQFGAVERPTHRNTSWDMARFETSAHRWVDLSEGGYGVALLNDSKYGSDVTHNVLRLTLLKSAVWPDADADQGVHRFTYALLPHAGDWRAGEVVRRAAELNAPLRAWRTTDGGPRTTDHGPRTTDHDSPIVHRPSSIVHRPASIVHRPSPIVHRPSSVVHRPSSIVHRPLSIVMPGTSWWTRSRRPRTATGSSCACMSRTTRAGRCESRSTARSRRRRRVICWRSGRAMWRWRATVSRSRSGRSRSARFGCGWRHDRGTPVGARHAVPLQPW